MKVRLEIIDDDGTESACVEFAGSTWKRRLLAFLDTFEDETDNISEPSSNSPDNMPGNYTGVPNSCNTGANVAGQNGYQPRFAPQQQPVNPNYQQSQAPVMQQPQQFRQVYAQPQQPVNPNYQPPQPQYVQSNLPPVGSHQYEYRQPVQPTSSTVRQPIVPDQQMPPAVPHTAEPVQGIQRSTVARRRTPMLQDRINDMSLTISERLELFLKYEYPRVWFSSQDVQQHYERVYGEIKQSTVSTYLSRMYRKKLLERRGNRTQREYRYIGDESEAGYNMDEVVDIPVNPLDPRFQY